MNNADKPLHLQKVQVKIVCEGEGEGKHKPIIVTATCPEHCYGSDYSSAEGKEQSYLTIPTTASKENPVSAAQRRARQGMLVMLAVATPSLAVSGLDLPLGTRRFHCVC